MAQRHGNALDRVHGVHHRKSGAIGSGGGCGVPVITLRSRTRRYCDFGRSEKVWAQLPLITSSACARWPSVVKFSTPPKAALEKQLAARPAPDPNQRLGYSAIRLIDDRN